MKDMKTGLACQADPVMIGKSLGTTSSLNSILPKTCRTEPLSPAQRKRGALLMKKMNSDDPGFFTCRHSHILQKPGFQI
jgi:hypothetical protein